MIIDFTTTATARPDIIDQTYSSFTKHLKGIDFDKCTLRINVDPVPLSIDRKYVLQVARKYFGNVDYNFPDKANYTAACNWVWTRANTDIIFNLEDDFIITEDVDCVELIKLFSDKRLYEVPLRLYGYVYDKIPTSPSFMHKRFYKKVAGNLDESLNPEVQLRGNNWGLEMPTGGGTNNGRVWCYPKHIIIKDIGREWMDKQNKLAKPSCKKAKFITWDIN